ncbi:hypothetical protein BN7_851 [Wickerhamomyces ciferrii]|uniref:Uncharacterized protein n=1 Tax=Wickerhamomyces ciferrii (strain ATCC 14091 / BCRC 22168 / CBS 111 / JCM 3599 / NBRC 0793 / NRRL Y-1031 F-60-10) TaxID=1206466 RepID=K0KGK6_WICCF|nr:uncharacterized protein BN7_851 [Wickerhamomyces ciferrii]CCH41312.1 hypothetical protein BN7_851 [Wickerhamomyces ciferrii]
MAPQMLTAPQPMVHPRLQLHIQMALQMLTTTATDLNGSTDANGSTVNVSTDSNGSSISTSTDSRDSSSMHLSNSVTTQFSSSSDSVPASSSSTLLPPSASSVMPYFKGGLLDGQPNWWLYIPAEFGPWVSVEVVASSAEANYVFTSVKTNIGESEIYSMKNVAPGSISVSVDNYVEGTLVFDIASQATGHKPYTNNIEVSINVPDGGLGEISKRSLLTFSFSNIIDDDATSISSVGSSTASFSQGTSNSNGQDSSTNGEFISSINSSTATPGSSSLENSSSSTENSSKGSTGSNEAATSTGSSSNMVTHSSSFGSTIIVSSATSSLNSKTVSSHLNFSSMTGNPSNGINPIGSSDASSGQTSSFDSSSSLSSFNPSSAPFPFASTYTNSDGSITTGIISFYPTTNSDGSLAYASTTLDTSNGIDLISNVIKKVQSTTVITVTSCSGTHQCTYVPITTGVTVLTETREGKVTEITTYCPLTTDQVQSGKPTSDQVQASSSTNNVSADMNSTGKSFIRSSTISGDVSVGASASTSAFKIETNSNGEVGSDPNQIANESTQYTLTNDNGSYHTDAYSAIDSNDKVSTHTITNDTPSDYPNSANGVSHASSHVSGDFSTADILIQQGGANLLNIYGTLVSILPVGLIFI